MLGPDGKPMSPEELAYVRSIEQPGPLNPGDPRALSARAKAGDAAAHEQLAALKAESANTSMPFETGKEVMNLDWNKEVSETASALHKSAQNAMDQAVQDTVDFVSDRYEAAKQLANMSGDEWKGVAQQEVEDAKNSTAGKTIQGAIDLAGMNADEVKGALAQVAQDTGDAIAHKVEEAKQLTSGWTMEELQGHASDAIDGAEKAIDHAAQALNRADPDAVRQKAADFTVEVGKQAVYAVATEGAGTLVEGATQAGKVAEGAEEASQLLREAGTAEAQTASELGHGAAADAAAEAPITRTIDTSKPSTGIVRQATGDSSLPRTAGTDDISVPRQQQSLKAGDTITDDHSIAAQGPAKADQAVTKEPALVGAQNSAEPMSEAAGATNKGGQGVTGGVTGETPGTGTGAKSAGGGEAELPPERQGTAHPGAPQGDISQPTEQMRTAEQALRDVAPKNVMAGRGPTDIEATGVTNEASAFVQAGIDHGTQFTSFNEYCPSDTANAPLLDGVSAKEWYSAKAHLVDNFEPAYAGDFQELLGVDDGDIINKQERTANFLAKNVDLMQTQQNWPADLATDREAVLTYIREETVMRIPSDHVDQVRKYIMLDAESNPSMYGLSENPTYEQLTRLGERIQSSGISTEQISQLRVKFGLKVR
jgi:hypothetical protein